MSGKQRLTNDNLSRALHQPLYERLTAFCHQYTPEFPADAIVSSWLNRLYNGDSNLHILVRFDDQWNINGHAVIDVQETYGYKVIYCHQAQSNKGAPSTLDEDIEYMDKLQYQLGAYCSVFITTKHSKAFEKKHNYKAVRTVMLKYGESNEDNS